MEVLFCPCICPPAKDHQCVKRATLSENGGTFREVWPKTLLHFQRTVCQHTLAHQYVPQFRLFLLNRLLQVPQELHKSPH